MNSTKFCEFRFQAALYHRHCLPGILCCCPWLLPLLLPLVMVLLLVPLLLPFSLLFVPSVPPNNGDMWFSDTCSINDVPYFLKYHHSNICKNKYRNKNTGFRFFPKKPEDHWSCIAHLIAEDMLKSAVIEEKTFKHSPCAGADNPLGPKFLCQQVGLITMVICCKFTKNPFNLWLYTHLFMI